MYTETCKDFVCRCLGIYPRTSEFIDKLCTNFDVDFDEEDLTDVISYSGKLTNVGNALIGLLYDKIINEIYEEYDNDENLQSLFDYNCDDFCSTLSFNGELYDNKKELYEAIEAYKSSKK